MDESSFQYLEYQKNYDFSILLLTRVFEYRVIRGYVLQLCHCIS